MRRIQTMAAQSSLTIRQFTPKAIATKELHAEWPIGLELEGTYHNVGLFLDRVSKFPRIINVGAHRHDGQHAADGRGDRARLVHGHDVRAARQSQRAGGDGVNSAGEEDRMTTRHATVLLVLLEPRGDRDGAGAAASRSASATGPSPESALAPGRISPTARRGGGIRS